MTKNISELSLDALCREIRHAKEALNSAATDGTWLTKLRRELSSRRYSVPNHIMREHS